MLSRVCTAIRMGYHRDPQHFKSLSPYQGEMRRRMWAIMYSLDLGFSTQLGLPSSIKHSLSDTMPPRNLQDRDFNASSVDLPPARPIEELTPSTVIIAKLHVATSMGFVSDMVCNPRPLSHEDLAAANERLDEMHATIPEPCKLHPLCESLLDPPNVVSQVGAMAPDIPSLLPCQWKWANFSAINSKSAFTCITKELEFLSTGSSWVLQRTRRMRVSPGVS